MFKVSTSTTMTSRRPKVIVKVPKIRFKYTLADYQNDYQVKVSGKYPTPSASNLTHTTLHVLAEDLIDTIHGLPVEFKRAALSPSKSRSKIKARDDFNLPTLVNDDDKEMLHFIIECIRYWLPPSGDCIGVPLPPTEDVATKVYDVIYETSYDSDSDEVVPPKRRCIFNTMVKGWVDIRLNDLRLKLQASNPFGNEQGKEICVALGNLVIMGMNNAESLLGTSKGRMTITEPVTWKDEETGMFISNGDAAILVDDELRFAFEVKSDTPGLGESQLAMHLLLSCTKQLTPVMGIIVSGEKHRLLKVSKSDSSFTIEQLQKLSLSDRASIIHFITFLFHYLRCNVQPTSSTLSCAGPSAAEPTSTNN